MNPTLDLANRITSLLSNIPNLASAQVVDHLGADHVLLEEAVALLEEQNVIRSEERAEESWFSLRPRHEWKTRYVFVNLKPYAEIRPDLLR